MTIARERARARRTHIDLIEPRVTATPPWSGAFDEPGREALLKSCGAFSDGTVALGSTRRRSVAEKSIDSLSSRALSKFRSEMISDLGSKD